MSYIWDTLIECQEQIIKEFDSRGKEIQEEGMSQFKRQRLDQQSLANRRL